ncbi:unnamed protein product, partial [Ilex paraguariensis]
MEKEQKDHNTPEVGNSFQALDVEEEVVVLEKDGTNNQPIQVNMDASIQKQQDNVMREKQQREDEGVCKKALKILTDEVAARRHRGMEDLDTCSRTQILPSPNDGEYCSEVPPSNAEQCEEIIDSSMTKNAFDIGAGTQFHQKNLRDPLFLTPFPVIESPGEDLRLTDLEIVREDDYEGLELEAENAVVPANKGLPEEYLPVCVVLGRLSLRTLRMTMVNCCLWTCVGESSTWVGPQWGPPASRLGVDRDCGESASSDAHSTLCILLWKEESLYWLSFYLGAVLCLYGVFFALFLFPHLDPAEASIGFSFLVEPSAGFHSGVTPCLVGFEPSQASSG